MRLVMVMVLAGLVALPLSAGAQDDEEDTTSESNLQEPPPSAEPASEEPALELKLDDAGVEVVPTPRRTAEGYTLEEMELRVKRAKIGLIAFAPLLPIGAIVMGSAASVESDGGLFPTAWTTRIVTGGVLMLIGTIGMVTSGVMLRVRKREQHWAVDGYTRPVDGYTRQELELRKRRAAFGLIAPAAVMLVGAALWVRGTTGDCHWPDWCNGPRSAGIALTTAGALGLLVGGIVVGVRAREVRTHYGKPRRAQWDLARSRLVF